MLQWKQDFVGGGEECGRAATSPAGFMGGALLRLGVWITCAEKQETRL